MSEGLAEEMLLEFFNAVEVGIVAARQCYKEKKGIKTEEKSWDPGKVKWQQAQGSSGPYERSEDANNPEFKIMLKDLAVHKGKLARGGFFYWTFQNGATVGRKLRARGKEDKPTTTEKSDAKTVEDIKQKFPEDLRNILSFECQADAIIIKPRQFLGSENFAKIASVVRGLGGEWKSAGKASYFRVPSTG